MNGCQVTFVCDDEKVTSDTFDGSEVSLEKENAKNRHKTVNDWDGVKSMLWDKNDMIEAVNMKDGFLVSRFVPDLMDSNKITIV